VTVKAAVITGAAGGIGTALCKAFKQAGYRTVAVDRQAGETDCEVFVPVDLDRYCREQEYREEADGRLAQAIGDFSLAVLVNNAAVQILGGTAKLSAADWQTTLNVNLLAPFLLAQALLERLKAGRGSIVNIASIHASLTKPGFVCYATSKAALVGLTRSMAVDIGAKVRVNAICPAAVSTPMLREGFAARPELLDELAALHPVGRIGEPEEIAAAALFLASEKSGFLNGSILGVDGGIASRLYDAA